MHPNTGWGALCEGRPAFGFWSDAEGRLHTHQLPRDDGSMWSPSDILTGTEGGHHVLVRSDSMTVESYINCQGRLTSNPLGVGTSQPAFIEGITCAQRIQPRSRHAISEQHPLRRKPASGSHNLGDLWQGRG